MAAKAKIRHRANDDEKNEGARNSGLNAGHEASCRWPLLEGGTSTSLHSTCFQLSHTSPVLPYHLLALTMLGPTLGLYLSGG